MMIALTTTEKIIKSRDRVRDNGEVFTPSWLVEDMLNLVSDEDWADPKKIFLEPACGNGNFLVAIYKKKIAFGSTPLQALQTIYGIDIMPDNIKECRQRLLRLALRSWHGLLLPNPKMMEAVRSNIRLGDALKFSMEDIFAPLNFASRELRGFRFEQKKNNRERLGKLLGIEEFVGKNNKMLGNSEYEQKWTNYPTEILEFSIENDTIYPTQKPVPLMEYLIRTYSHEGETVLDNVMGSGTTGIAAANTNRNFIGIEMDEKYFELSQERIGMIRKRGINETL